MQKCTNGMVLYFVTFSTYGSHLSGDERGSFDHSRRGENRFIEPHRGLERYCRERMNQPPYLLSNISQRQAVSDGIRNVCESKGWFLYALHVRTTHLHGVTEADANPSQILRYWKTAASRTIVQRLGESDGVRRWTHGGSVRTIQDAAALTRVVRYVITEQGEPMQVFQQIPGT